jgi:hypothetical protein
VTCSIEEIPAAALIAICCRTPRAVFGLSHPLRGDVLAAIGRDAAGVPE